MRICDIADTGRTLVLSGLPLAVSCRRCAHRMLLNAEQIEAHANDRRPLVRLPLLCRCGSRQIDCHLLETPDEARTFLDGVPLQVDRGDGNGLWRPSF
jgi:hypothetical protein